MLNIRHQWHKIQLSLLLFLLTPLTITAQTPPVDMLAYTTNYNTFPKKTDLMIYDPLTQSSSLLRSDIEPGQFKLSVDRQLAFSQRQSGKVDVYVLNTLNANNAPKNVSQNPEAYNYPLGWSPDSRYLAYASRKAGNRSIYIWDGNKTVNITPDNTDPTSPYFYGSDISWSNDNRLAFTVWYPTKEDVSEIYLWNGTKTINLSQNPIGEDGRPTWNIDGQLAFLSARNGVYDIFIWDGLSYVNSLPDTNKFTNIVPELTSYMSFPTWANNKSLAFEAQSSEDTHFQIYLWNGNTATNISKNPNHHNGSAHWSRNGLWAFTTFFSSQQLLYIRDSDNHVLLTVEGQSIPAWSNENKLAFCTESTVLSIWNGKTVNKIAEGGAIFAQWFSGSSIFCSSG